MVSAPYTNGGTSQGLGWSTECQVYLSFSSIDYLFPYLFCVLLPYGLLMLWKMYWSKLVHRFSQWRENWLDCKVRKAHLDEQLGFREEEGFVLFRCEWETLSRKWMDLRTGEFARNWSKSMKQFTWTVSFSCADIVSLCTGRGHMQPVVLIFKYSLKYWKFLLLSKFFSKINTSIEISDCTERIKH